jgi:hypothetical protein
MQLKSITLGLLISLVGCYSTPTYEHSNVLQLAPIPKSQDFTNSSTVSSMESYLNYRDALLSYQLYLSGYIAYYDQIYKIKPTVTTLEKKNISCSKPNSIILPNTPTITESMTESEINEVLFRHIQELRQTIKHHNDELK